MVIVPAAGYQIVTTSQFVQILISLRVVLRLIDFHTDQPFGFKLFNNGLDILYTFWMGQDWNLAAPRRSFIDWVGV